VREALVYILDFSRPKRNVSHELSSRRILMPLLSKYLHKGESKSRTTLQFESCRGCSSCWFYLLTAGPKVSFKTITYKYLHIGFLSYSKTYNSNGLLNKEVHNYNSFHAWLSSILLPPDISLKHWPYCKLFVYTSDYVCALFQISMQT